MTKIRPENLLFTDKGKNWLDQFDDSDKDIAQRVVRSLTLVSQSEFGRAIQTLIEEKNSANNGPIAFYAIREMEFDTSYFDKYTALGRDEVDALSEGADHGSEAIIANLVRQYCKVNKKALLNHPVVEKLRANKCHEIVLIDDFLGTGSRAEKFLDAFLKNRTITSWYSLKYIQFHVVAFSGTEKGIKRVERHRARPKISIVRSCPTFREMPWGKSLKDGVIRVCRKYGRTSYWDGHGDHMASIVFEHGCPNNNPAILWSSGDRYKKWIPLFPKRSVLADEKSVFPIEIARRDPKLTLLDIGQKRVASSGALLRRGQKGQTILLVLALIAQGQRKRTTISFATGLDLDLTSRIIEDCIGWKFITRSFRLTKEGKAELDVARVFRGVNKIIPTCGDDCYYPTQLRRPAHG